MGDGRHQKVNFMNRRPYAGEITKDYLKKLGIEYVSTDGTVVVKNGKPINICFSEKTKKPYGYVHLYDSNLYASLPKEERTSHSGVVTITIHVLNYVWNVADKPTGMVVHHKDNNPRNNDISNLRCETQRENILEERPLTDREIECNMLKPLSYYEEMLERLDQEYEQAKIDGDARRVHNLRSYKSQLRGKIRYWNSHAAEHEELLRLQAAKEEAKAKKALKAEHIKILKALASEAKSKGDKHRWHNLIRVHKNYDAFTQTQIIKIIEKETKKESAC